MTDDAAAAVVPPLLRVVRGQPTPEELAALVAVLVAAARATGADGADVRPASRWASRVDAVRAPVAAGPHAWRTSAWRH